MIHPEYGIQLIAHFIFKISQYAQASEYSTAVGAGRKLHACLHLFFKLFKLQILITVDDVFGFVVKVVDAEVGAAHFGECAR